MIGGNIKASVDELIEPTSEIIGPKFGTAMAMITVTKKNRNLVLNVGRAIFTFTCKKNQYDAQNGVTDSTIIEPRNCVTNYRPNNVKWNIKLKCVR